MRHLSYLFSAAVLFAGACGGGGDTGPVDMATGGGGGDMATGGGDMTSPDMADNKPIITLTINQLAPATGPCMGVATIKGKGTITDSAGKLTCNGTTCTGSYTKGQMITLTATPDPTSSAFATWGGDCKNGQDLTQPTCTVTVDGTTTITADFIRSYYVSVQLTDMTAQLSAIRVYSDMAATQKIAEVLPSPNSITTTTCLDKVKGDVVYAGVQVPAGKNLFGPSCALPTVCKYEVTGGTQLYWRVY